MTDDEHLIEQLQQIAGAYRGHMIGRASKQAADRLEQLTRKSGIGQRTMPYSLPARPLNIPPRADAKAGYPLAPPLRQPGEPR
jgi:hypothetical protein